LFFVLLRKREGGSKTVSKQRQHLGGQGIQGLLKRACASGERRTKKRSEGKRDDCHRGKETKVSLCQAREKKQELENVFKSLTTASGRKTFVGAWEMVYSGRG